MFEDVKRTLSESRRLQQQAQEARIVRAALREIGRAYIDVLREQLDRSAAVLAASRRIDRTAYDNALHHVRTPGDKAVDE